MSGRRLAIGLERQKSDSYGTRGVNVAAVAGDERSTRRAISVYPRGEQFLARIVAMLVKLCRAMPASVPDSFGAPGVALATDATLFQSWIFFHVPPWNFSVMTMAAAIA